jgi:hypothetical protein
VTRYAAAALAEAPSRINDATIARLTAGAGLAVVVLFIVASAIASPFEAPKANSGAAKVVEYFGEDRGRFLASMYLNALAWCAAFLVFVVGLRALLRRSEEPSALLSSIGLAGGVVQAAVLTIFFLMGAVLSYRAALIVDPTVASALYDAQLLLNNFSGFPSAVCLGGFAAAILTTRQLPPWVAWLGIAVAFLHLVAAADFARHGLFSPTGVFGFGAPIGYALWMAAVSLAVFRRERMGLYPRTETPPPAKGKARARRR